MLSPAAFLQGWTLVLAGSPWLGGHGDVSFCTSEAGGSALARRPQGRWALQQGFSPGGISNSLLAQKSRTCPSPDTAFLADLSKKAWIRHKVNLTVG